MKRGSEMKILFLVLAPFICLLQPGAKRFSPDRQAEKPLPAPDWSRLSRAETEDLCRQRNQQAWKLAMELGNHEGARQMLEETIPASLPKDHPEVLRTRHYLAMVYLMQGRLDESIALESGLLKVREAQGDQAGAAIHLDRIGLAQKARGDLDAALTCFREAAAKRRALYGADSPKLAGSLRHIGNTAGELGNLDEAVAALTRSLGFYRATLPDEHSSVTTTSWLLGRTLVHRGDYDDAAPYLFRALADQEKAYPENHPYLAHSHMELGRLLTCQGKYNEALPHLEEARQQFNKLFGTSNYHLAESLNHLAWTCWHRRDLAAAATWMEKALQSLNYHPGVSLLAANEDDHTLLSCLQGKAVILVSLYLQDGDLEHLQTALVCLRDGVRLMEAKRRGYLTQQAGLDINKRFRQLLVLAVPLAVEAYERTGDKVFLRQAFNFSERGKMAVLMDGLAQAPAEPRGDLDSFQAMPKHRALLSYHLGDEVLTIFALADQVTVRRVPLEQGGASLAARDWLLDRPGSGRLRLQRDIEALRKNLYFANAGVARFYAKTLYRKLIAPVSQQIEGRDLLIVPDGNLGLLPFEALLDDGDAWLVRKHRVSYTYAVDLISNATPWRFKGGAGFAPLFDGEGLQALPGAEAEVREIQTLCEQQGIPFPIFPVAASNKASFIDWVSGPGVLHLAAHGKTLSGQSMLFLGSGVGEEFRLTAEDVGKLSIQADLVVLSACDSGNGEPAPGEGIRGFPRAFFQAGAQAVLAGQWPVADQAARTLMVPFYEELLAGHTPEQALHRTRQALIEAGVGPEIWAPFVLISRRL